MIKKISSLANKFGDFLVAWEWIGYPAVMAIGMGAIMYLVLTGRIQ